MARLLPKGLWHQQSRTRRLRKSQMKWNHLKSKKLKKPLHYPNCLKRCLILKKTTNLARSSLLPARNWQESTDSLWMYQAIKIYLSTRQQGARSKIESHKKTNSYWKGCKFVRRLTTSWVGRLTVKTSSNWLAKSACTNPPCTKRRSSGKKLNWGKEVTAKIWKWGLRAQGLTNRCMKCTIWARCILLILLEETKTSSWACTPTDL